MLDIKTKYGIFSNYEDFLRYLEEENIKDTVFDIEVKYVLDTIFKGKITLEEIKEIIKLNKEEI